MEVERQSAGIDWAYLFFFNGRMIGLQCKRLVFHLLNNLAVRKEPRSSDGGQYGRGGFSSIINYGRVTAGHR